MRVGGRELSIYTTVEMFKVHLTIYISLIVSLIDVTLNITTSLFSIYSMNFLPSKYACKTYFT